MAGIEFVGADPDDDTGEDVLDTGPRRPIPRWVWAVAVLAVIAVAVGVLVSSRSDGAPDARSSPSRSAPTSAEPASAPGAPISALTSDGTSLFWIAGTRLYRAGPVGRAGISTAISPSGGDFAEVQLVPDPAERTIWVVSHGSSDSTGGAGNIEGFTTDDLTRVVRASAQSLIGGAAVLNGALYVLAAGKLLRATTTSSGLTKIASVDPRAHDLVAVDDALLYVEGGNSSALGRWTPSGVQKPEILETTDSTLGVVGSKVFIAGTRNGQSELDQYDRFSRPPTTPVSGEPPPDSQIVALGRSSLIVLGMGRSGLLLACVDAGTARVAASAPATSANVAVLRGVVYQAVGDGVRPVSFAPDGCAG